MEASSPGVSFFQMPSVEVGSAEHETTVDLGRMREPPRLSLPRCAVQPVRDEHGDANGLDTARAMDSLGVRLLRQAAGTRWSTSERTSAPPAIRKRNLAMIFANRET